MLSEAGESFIVVSVGKRAKEFNGIIRLNEAGALLFNALKNGAEKEDLVKLLTDEYEIDGATAEKEAEKFIDKAKETGILENDR